MPPIYKRYFACPNCGSLSMSVSLVRSEDDKDSKVAVVLCGNCGLRCELLVPAGYEKVDVYNIVSDYVYEGRLEECRQLSGGEGESALGEGHELSPGEEE